MKKINKEIKLKKQKNDRAITLIALVVTIIILLILAGVAIGFAMNGTGLFDKAKLATEEYNNKVAEENFELEKSINIIDDHVDGTREIVSKEEYDRLKNAYDDLKNSKLEHIASHITDENSVAEYTYTATQEGQLMVIVYSFISDAGSFGDCYCKKNNEVLTPTVNKDWGRFRHFREYLIDIEENDIINCRATCSGSLGTNGYVIYYKK